MADTTLVFGPPGTGKTSYLMRLVSELVREGVHPSMIALCSYTIAAVEEATTRMRQDGAVHGADLPWWRTMHSMGARVGGFPWGSYVTPAWRSRFAKAAGYVRSKDEEDEDEDGGIVTHPLRAALALHDLARLCCVPIAQAWATHPKLQEVVSASMAARIAYEYELAKREDDKHDYVDMLLALDEQEWVPPVSHIVVDEAQDLAPLQWRIVNRWIQAKDRQVWIAGDDDQTVYGHQGSDPRFMLDVPGMRVTLSQSYRVPRLVHQLATRLISRNRTRQAKQWAPRDETGGVYRDVPLDVAWREVDDLGCSAFFLTRTRYQLRTVADMLIGAAVPFLGYRSPFTRHAPVVRAALRLATTHQVGRLDLDRLVSALNPGAWTRTGRHRHRQESSGRVVFRLDQELCRYWIPEVIAQFRSPDTCLAPVNLPSEARAYFYAIIRRRGPQAIDADPKIKIQTIHQSKGAEADYVWVSPVATRSPYLTATVDPEPERRIAYVALTRTRNHLAIGDPRDWDAESYPYLRELGL